VSLQINSTAILTTANSAYQAEGLVIGLCTESAAPDATPTILPGTELDGLQADFPTPFTLTGVVSGVATGTYNVGLCGYFDVEILPQIVLNGCSAATGTNTATVSFTVTTNAPIGNVLLTGTTNNSVDATATFAPLTGTATGGYAANTVAGQMVNSTTLQFTFATPVAVVFAGPVTITVSNIRVNASAVPSGTQITSTFAPVGGFTSMNTTAGNSLTASEAFTAPTLTTSKLTGYNNVAICATSGTSVNVAATVQVFENFVGSLTTQTQEFTKESVGGINLITANPAGGATAAASTLTGTIIAVAFNNLVSNVNYYVPATVTVPAGVGFPAVYAPTGLTFVLVSGPTSITPIVGGPIGAATGVGYPGGALAGVAQLSASSNSATAYYLVTLADGGALASTVPATSQALGACNGGDTACVGGLTAVPPLGTYVSAAGPTYDATRAATTAALGGMINLYEVVPSTTTVGSSTPITASVTLASNAATSYPQFAAVPSPTVLTIKTGLLGSCNTTLIFPYVLTSSGYDTGIELGNAAPGSSVSGNTISNTAAGSCTMTAYGSAAFGGPAITAFPLANSPLAVPSGTVNAFTLSTALPAATPVFVGYLIASCNYQGAHGFGFVFGGAGGSTGGAGLSYGYLAPILADVFNATPQAQNIQY
jgi:hypothetical protein